MCFQAHSPHTHTQVLAAVCGGATLETVGDPEDALVEELSEDFEDESGAAWRVALAEYVADDLLESPVS